MNAQEAIENEQIELDELKGELKKREVFVNAVNAVNYDGLNNARTFQIEQVKMIKKMIEQKSIILESAKLFHKHSVPRMFSELKSSLGKEECKKIKTVYGVPIESVGIEVEQ